MKTRIQKCDSCGTLNENQEAGWLDVIGVAKTAQVPVDICPECSAKPISTITDILVKATTPNPPKPKIVPEKPIQQPKPAVAGEQKAE